MGKQTRRRGHRARAGAHVCMTSRTRFTSPDERVSTHCSGVPAFALVLVHHKHLVAQPPGARHGVSRRGRRRKQRNRSGQPAPRRRRPSVVRVRVENPPTKRAKPRRSRKDENETQQQVRRGRSSPILWVHAAAPRLGYLWCRCMPGCKEQGAGRSAAERQRVASSGTRARLLRARLLSEYQR